MRSTPSAMASRSQRLRSCSASGMRSPAGPVRASRRALVRIISASRPATSPSSGSRRWTARVSRTASSLRSARCRSGPDVDVYPSLSIRYSTWSTTFRRSSRSSAGGISNVAPAALMCCLARLMRCAIVDSGTRKAWAISAVVRPPTARKVSASCDGADSVGWQHRNSSVSVSSAAGAAQASSAAGARAASTGRSAASRSSRRRLAVSLRTWSVMRRAATVTSQPRGLAGMPSSGHCTAAAVRASWTASSQASNWPEPADERAEDLRREVAQQVLDDAL